jgi:hypothetical protein
MARRKLAHLSLVFALPFILARCTPVPKADAAQSPAQNIGASGNSLNTDLSRKSIPPPEQSGLIDSSISRTSPSNQSGFGNLPGQAAGTLQDQPISGNPSLHLGTAPQNTPVATGDAAFDQPLKKRSSGDRDSWFYDRIGS